MVFFLVSSCGFFILGLLGRSPSNGHGVNVCIAIKFRIESILVSLRPFSFFCSQNWNIDYITATGELHPCGD